MIGDIRDNHAAEFTTTRWSMVLRAGGANAEDARFALEELCRDYWYPLYAFIRRKGCDPDQAADLTQEFFLKLLSNDFAQGLSQQGGRFRSFLLTALNRFLITEWQRSKRIKRGGNVAIGSLEALIIERGEASYLHEMSHSGTPKKLFQRAWAETLLERVLARLEAECVSRQDHRFVVLKPFLSAGTEPSGLENAARELSLTVPAFKSLLHRFRERYRQALLDEIGQTVGSRADIADEMRGLLQAMRG